MTNTPIRKHEVSALNLKIKQSLYWPEQALKVPRG
jgi:hypothetical protein